MVLGNHLRRLREARRISAEDAGYTIRASHSKISRMELGRVGFKERDVADLLSLYGVGDGEEREALLGLARESNTPGWWHRYGDVLPGWFEAFLGLEEAASLIRAYEVHFVPGLLQSEDYARAVIRLGHTTASDEEIERRVRMRMSRRRLTEPDASPFWAVIDETALHRSVGSRSVMRGQVEHLIELADLGNLTLQIVPLSAAAHPAAGAPFSIMRFAEPALPDVVYLEHLTSAIYLDKSADVDAYMLAMNDLCLAAADPAESLKLLERLRRELS